jgi:thermostable 8-oxoguanine DNA glycosylase
MTMAQNSLLFGFDALKGQKTNAFARNIAGDTNAVTIDVWMIRAAGFDAAKGVNKSEYNLLADCVRDVAAAFGLSPAVMQALIWIVARGDAK